MGVPITKFQSHHLSPSCALLLAALRTSASSVVVGVLVTSGLGTRGESVLADVLAASSLLKDVS
jgi:hypothetical protein